MRRIACIVQTMHESFNSTGIYTAGEGMFFYLMS
jgi:hypothetical protein